MVSPDITFLIPRAWKSATLSGDTDLTTLWAEQPFARALYNNTATAANIQFVDLEGNTVTAYVLAGAAIFGQFKTLKVASTTATAVLIGK